MCLLNLRNCMKLLGGDSRARVVPSRHVSFQGYNGYTRTLSASTSPQVCMHSPSCWKSGYRERAGSLVGDRRTTNTDFPRHRRHIALATTVLFPTRSMSDLIAQWVTHVAKMFAGQGGMELVASIPLDPTHPFYNTVRTASTSVRPSSLRPQFKSSL